MRVILLLLLSIFMSCAGPTNPFGGDIFIGQSIQLDKTFKGENINVSLSPDRQYYNSPYELKIKIIDPDFDITNFRYEIVYNNKVLNRWIKSEEIRFPKTKAEPVEIIFKNLSILPGNINKIDFLYYPSKSETPVVYKLKVPECSPDFQNNHFQINPFDISDDIKNNISRYSNEYKYNPSLIAALIAQESSFDPQAISIAKALGLTQVTPNAHNEIKRYKKEWNIYPKFSDLSIGSIKRKVRNNKINAKNDWRLDTEKSIEGGMIYLDYLKSYWGTPDKMEILSKAFKDEIPQTDILLASYNSGASRVKNAIIEKNKFWLSHKKLKEAKKYVMNIKSYCYSFNKGLEHEK